MDLRWGHVDLNFQGRNDSKALVYLSQMMIKQVGSDPQRKYQEGMKKDDYWSYALEDCLDIIATWLSK